jgi:hypothetical protein
MTATLVLLICKFDIIELLGNFKVMGVRKSLWQAVSRNLLPQAIRAELGSSAVDV